RAVVGEDADEGGGRSHHDERPHQHGLAAHLVAEMAREEGPERAEEEAHTDRGEADERTVGAERREEQLPEDEADRGGIDEEVVPLDRGADDGGENDTPPIGG
ncbi:hypothetical protein ABE10_01290, partial [Bacillus toyonensis]|nr:hypothetical protein [Bacillus toyonensis]